MSKPEKLKEKAKSLEARDPKAAIEAWLEALRAQEEEGEPNPDLSIFNRVGDLYLKVKDPAQAADYYDRAVDKYAELGFHNNAIAMCNKVLRNAPARQTTYLKLAKLYAAKGFMAEAKQNFLEYAERMQRIGKIQHAFAALKEFTDISPESAHLRGMLEEHLKMYGDAARPSAGTTPAPGAKSEHLDDVSKSAKRKTSSLVFLDVDEPPVPKAKPGAKAGPPSPAPTRAPSSPSSPPPLPRPEPDAVGQSLIEPVTAEPDAPLEIESTSLVEGLKPTEVSETLEGFETTSVDFGSIELEAGGLEVPSLREDVTAEDVQPMADLDPTVPEDAESAEPEVGLEPLLEREIERPAPPSPPPASSPRAAAAPAGPDKPRVGSPNVGRPPKAASSPPVVPGAPQRRPAGPPPPPPPPQPPAAKSMPHVGSPPRFAGPKGPAPRVAPSTPEPPKVKPVVPKRPAAPPPVPPPPKGKAVVEVPPLELEPDFETTITEASHEVDEEPLAPEDIPPTGGFVQTEDDTSITGRRRSAFIDLGVDGVVNQGEATGSLVFANIEATPATPTIEELEARVADNPDDPEAHQALGEALIEAGERERGIEELDHATAGFENLGNLSHAQDLVNEILRLDPNSVRHRQKQVEFAFKSGDKVRLIDAYLELADTLLRQDLPEKARAVYQRVAEHDATNERANAALSMLAPVAAPAPEEKPKARKEERTAPKDAKMKVRHEAVEEGEFVDLGSMILEEGLPTRDTRMKVADEEPSGDEEKDFQEMLARFKQGIDENIDEADFQSHFDLGVAFKEMGLLDEAISEFQKALRAPEGKLKSSEALGVCFIDKAAYVVAESILRRGLELPASGDQERLGILYWLGRALEEQGKKAEARELYGRVFAVDIRFKDVGARARALAKGK
ncbi:MAG TPA: tetratricopeptide repeat protein [Gemmatimonadales bacterium]|nr:tetratricopeptide repeat protein [Gemmatimonadales bacterium]